MSESESTGLKTPEMIGERYLLLRELREEPWGDVWLARDHFLSMDVGLKLLPRDNPQFEAGSRVLQQEALLAARLRHPLILGVSHLGETEECLYALQDPFGGESLLALLTRQHRLSLAQALQILEQVGEALAFAHESGIVHQSFSPLHVLLEGEEVRVANFAFPAGNDEDVRHLELKAYDPPEVLREEPLTPAGNVFSLGVLGFRCLSGSLPYSLTFDEAFPYRLESPPVDLEEIPTPLQNVLLHCLAEDPEERFHNAGEFLGQLRELRDMWRSGRRERWVDWQPERHLGAQAPGKGGFAREQAALAAEMLGELWAGGKKLATRAWEGLGPRLANLRAAAPPRLWWGLGLAGLVVILALASVKLLGQTKVPLSSLLPVAGPAGPSAQHLPAAGGPPQVQMEEPSPPAREPAPAAKKPGAPAPAAAPPAPPAAKPPAREERYLVLAASYGSREGAVRLQKRLQARNLNATLAKVQVGGKPGYQVQIGPLTGAKAAEEVAQRLKSEEHLSPKVVKVTAKAAKPPPKKPAPAKSTPVKPTAARSHG
jgi:serine/threonine-protein kinase